ncbi:MAG: PqqD family protein [Thermoplasmata archaeon]|nr:PqqD family protein [Thermoplasmata archaeon]RLF28167.1 MAG: PqqD family protein [Thermoplasmata archaeon]
MGKKRNLSLDEVLQFKPKRKEFKWVAGDDETVVITIPKFKSRIGRWFCKAIGKDLFFTAHLDNIGSEVWKRCDGATTVGEILNILRERFPNEKELDKRLLYYLYRMDELGYISI